MTKTERERITKDLVRASDALHSAFQRAAFANELDLAARLRRQVKDVGTTIFDIGNAAERPAQSGAPS